jgi:hypothetical protein
MTRRQPGIRWAYLAVGVSLVAFAVLGVGLLMAGMGSLAGLPGPATPGGFRDNDPAAVATCFGALALVFAYASYRSMRR